MDLQWYPGHMTKARRMMEENIRLVDLVIELVDARIPLSSRNPDIDALCTGKGRVVLLCKADLADPVRTQEFVDYFQKKGILAVALDARERKAGDIVRRYVQEACREKTARDRARGIVGRPLRAMVAGIPNVGKSTFINSFSGRASTKTGNKPGVTRGKQWIRMGSGVELLDTPGILWPKFDNPLIGMRLALVGAIRDEILDKQELAVWLLDYLEREYPGMVEEKYFTGAERAAQTEDPGPESPDPQIPAGYALLLEIARARRLLMKGGEPDGDRAAALLIDDCKNGRIGRISLDRPGDADAMEEERKEFLARQEREKDAAARKKTGKRPADRESANRSGGAGGRARETGYGRSGKTSPGSGRISPGSGRTSPGSGRISQGRGKTSPGSGKTSPGRGKTSPGSGRTRKAPGRGKGRT